MEDFWRRNASWGYLGATLRVPAPQLPKRPKVRVRAIGPRRFLLDGEIVAEGAVVSVDADDAPMLIFAGKAELIT